MAVKVLRVEKVESGDVHEDNVFIYVDTELGEFQIAVEAWKGEKGQPCLRIDVADGFEDDASSIVSVTMNERTGCEVMYDSVTVTSVEDYRGQNRIEHLNRD